MSNVPAPTTPQGLAVPSGVPEGLEDIEASDLTLPIWKINHKGGTFVDTLTNEEHTSFDAVILGVIKQRILWPMEISEGEAEAPMCRCYEQNPRRPGGNIGYPRSETWVTPQKNNKALTAQKLSGFTWEQVEAAGEGTGLSCGNCALKDWGADRTPPWCNEQWTMPFARLDQDGDPIMGVISFQRTGIKPCKSYISGFAQAKSALFTVVTRIKAVVQSRGTVEWVVPSFQRLQESDSTLWPVFSESLHSVRDYLTTPRIFTEVDPEAEAAASAVVPATATATPVAVQKPAPAPVTPDPEPVPDPEPEPAPVATQTEGETEQAPAPALRAQPPAPQAPAPAAAAAPPAAPAGADYDPDEEPF